MKKSVSSTSFELHFFFFAFPGVMERQPVFCVSVCVCVCAAQRVCGPNASPPEQRLHSADDVSQVKGQRHAGVVRAPEGPVHRGLLGGERLGQTGVAPEATGQQETSAPINSAHLHHSSDAVGPMGHNVIERPEQQQLL